MFSTQPITIEILASGKPPAEISLRTNSTDVAFTVLPDKTDGQPLNNQRYRPPNTLFKCDNTLQNNAKNLLLSDKNQDKIQKTSPQADLDFFFKLDAKLQRFKDMARRHRKKQDNTEPQVLHRRPFMTVVRQGTFLKPPPELAALLGLPNGQGQGSVTSTPVGEGPLNASHPGARRPLLLYSFSSRPRVLHHTKQQNADDPEKEERKLYFGRDRSAPVATVEPVQQQKEESPAYQNYMYDRRTEKAGVVSYSQPKLAQFTQVGLSTTGPDIRRTESRRQAIVRRRSHGYRSLPGRGSSTTPPPLPGRQHLLVQTDQFLEELVARPPETDAASQTDEFADVPVSPPYVPAVKSVDASTQIEQGELIELEADVEPVLDSLVSSTVVKALVEVLEEEEIASCSRLHAALREKRRLQQEEYRRIQNEKRLMEERDRILQYAHFGLDVSDLSKRAAALFAQVHVAQVLPGVLQSLPCGLADDIEQSMPMVIGEVQEEFQRLLTNNDIIADIVREVVHTRAEIRRAMGGPSLSRSGTLSSTTSGGDLGDGISAQHHDGDSQQPPLL